VRGAEEREKSGDIEEGRYRSRDRELERKRLTEPDKKERDPRKQQIAAAATDRENRVNSSKFEGNWHTLRYSAKFNCY
jgi:hypothetical protein